MINVPSPVVEQFSSVSIACSYSCWTNINIHIPSDFDQMTIKHIGQGLLEEYPGSINIENV